MTDHTPKTLEVLLASEKQVFLKLWKKGCGPCQLSTSAIERIEKKWAGEIHFAQISVTEYPEMLEIAETDVLPIFFAFENGKLLSRLEGFKGLKSLEEFTSKFFKTVDSQNG